MLVKNIIVKLTWVSYLNVSCWYLEVFVLSKMHCMK